MPLKEAQKQVDGWISQYKEGYWSPFEILARLIEEVGELGREINHAYGHKKRNQLKAKKKWPMKSETLFLR